MVDEVDKLSIDPRVKLVNWALNSRQDAPPEIITLINELTFPSSVTEELVSILNKRPTPDALKIATKFYNLNTHKAKQLSYFIVKEDEEELSKELRVLTTVFIGSVIIIGFFSLQIIITPIG